LRDAALLEAIPGPGPNIAQRLGRLRGDLLQEVDALLGASTDGAAVARAMLLGDRSFVDREQAQRFQGTGAYHGRRRAGLPPGARAGLVVWARRALRLSLASGTLLTLAALAGYVLIVEDRTPILRAALMAAVYLVGRMLFRRTYLLNAVGV